MVARKRMVPLSGKERIKLLGLKKPQKKKAGGRTATVFDINSILRIQKQHLMSMKKEGSGRSGFLIHKFTRAKLGKIILGRAGKVYVSRGVRGKGAYLVGHFNKRWLDNPKIKLQVYSKKGKKIISGEYAYLQHIATSSEAHARTALELERRFERDAKKRGVPYILGEVALEPLNKTSLDFHLKRGSELIASYKASKTNVTWGVLAKEI